MISIARRPDLWATALRRLVLATTVAALLATLGAPGASAATYSIRLEAGPQAAVAFSATWTVTARKTITRSTPTTVTGTTRKSVAGLGIYLRISSGSLAGWWVRESSIAYIKGYAGLATYSPPRSRALPVGRYELYRFDAVGAMTQAKARVVSAATTFRSDRTAVINGRRYVRIADGTWAGWWMPGTAESPTRITCTAGSPPTATTARVVRYVSSATGEIALTFDMGGRVTPALAIVRFLELERVCATIFPTGATAATTTGHAVLAEVSAHPELFEVGNHTVHHCNLRDGGGGTACPTSRPSAAFVTGELKDADAIIAPLAGRHTTPYWRPPYGAVDSTLAGVAAAAGYPYTIMWSTDTIDWRPVADGGPTAAQISAKVLANRRAGGIVLMHLGGYNTLNALPAMIKGLRASGYTPTTISALYR